MNNIQNKSNHFLKFYFISILQIRVGKMKCFHVISSSDPTISDSRISSGFIGSYSFRLSDPIGSYRRNPSKSNVGNRRKLTDNAGFRQSDPIGPDCRKLSDSVGSDRIQRGQFDLGTYKRNKTSVFVYISLEKNSYTRYY